MVTAVILSGVIAVMETSLEIEIELERLCEMGAEMLFLWLVGIGILHEMEVVVEMMSELVFGAWILCEMETGAERLCELQVVV